MWSLPILDDGFTALGEPKTIALFSLSTVQIVGLTLRSNARWRPKIRSKVEEIVGHLSAGRPVVAAVQFYEGHGWEEPTPDGRITDGGTKFLSFSTSILIVGVDATGYRFANSWGWNWGDHGFGSMSGETAKAVLLEDQLWAIEVPWDEPMDGDDPESDTD
jgi:hypothetical protein